MTLVPQGQDLRAQQDLKVHRVEQDLRDQQDLKVHRVLLVVGV